MVETEELGLVAALAVMGHRPVESRSRGHRTAFVFDEVTRPLVDDFYSGRMMLPAVAMSEAVRAAKGAAMNAGRNGSWSME